MAEAYDFDMGRSIARVSPSILMELDVEVGDVCAVGKEWSTPVKIWRCKQGDWGQGKVFLDKFSRSNIAAEVGSEVPLKPIEVSVADEIVLHGYRSQEIDISEKTLSYFRSHFINRAISIGDIVPISIDDLENIPFVIGHLRPKEPCLIKESTTIRVNE